MTEENEKRLEKQKRKQSKFVIEEEVFDLADKKLRVREREKAKDPPYGTRLQKPNLLSEVNLYVLK